MADFLIPDDLSAAVIGDPIAHSLSPLMHNAWIEACDSLADKKAYGKLQVKADQLDDFFAAFRASPLVGVNVTVPHKEAVIPYLTRLSPGAKAVGAVNTILKQGDDLVGFNTDGIGFLNHLKASAPSWRSDRPVLVIGAGGAARGILHTLLTTEVPMVMVANRSIGRANQLVADIGRGRAVDLPMDNLSDAITGAGLVVNTTSLGMAGCPPLDLPLDRAGADTVVYDIVYNPLETDLLKAANGRGLTTVDGLGMLIHQGAAAFKIWFGETPDTGDAVRNRLLAAL